MPDSDSFTGSNRPLLTETQDIHNDRRRLFWLLPNGTRHVVTIRMADDSNDYRNAIADALLAERRGLIRGGRIVER